MNYLLGPPSAEPMLVRRAKSNWRAVNFVVVQSVDVRASGATMSKLTIIIKITKNEMLKSTMKKLWIAFINYICS